jgi:hypothetical protein
VVVVVVIAFTVSFVESIVSVVFVTELVCPKLVADNSASVKAVKRFFISVDY